MPIGLGVFTAISEPALSIALARVITHNGSLFVVVVTEDVDFHLFADSSSGRQRDSIMGHELACPYFKTVSPFKDADILELYHNLAKLIR